MCDIAVTPGSGKTVATTTDQSREFQQVVVSTIMVTNSAGVPLPLGYAAGGSSMPVSVLNFPASQAVTGTFFQTTQPAYITNVTSSPIQIQTNAGVLTGVGYQANGASVPVSVLNFPASQAVTGTFFQASQPTTVSTGGVTAAQGPAGSSYWGIDLSTGVRANQGLAGTNDWRVTFATGNVTQGLPGTNDWRVTFATGNVTQGLPGTNDWTVRMASTNIQGTTLTGTSLNVNVTGGATIASNFVNITTTTPGGAIPAQLQIQGVQSYFGLGGIQRIDLTSATYVTPQLLISSAALPNSGADKSSTTVSGDPHGRMIIVAGVPPTMMLSTSPVTALAGFIVLVASPSATTFTHICGCAWTNTSATAVNVTMYPSGGVVSTNLVLPLPAADSRGVWPGCDEPWLNTTVGGVQVTARVSAAASSVTGYCQFYQDDLP